MPYASDYSQDPICRLCKVPYANHPRCQCCGIFCGPNHFSEGLLRYRGKRLCSLCIEEWKGMEKRAGGKVPWEIFSDRSRYYRADGELLKEVRR